MNRSSPPKKQPLPFGTNGQRENLLEDTPAGDNTASYSKGFPPVTMILKAAGGLPPKGQDMNQILFELSDLMRWASTGAINSFDPAFSSAISGYPSGALILSDAGDKIFISVIDNNTDNPNSTNTGSWKNAADFIGVSESVQQDIDGKADLTQTFLLKGSLGTNDLNNVVGVDYQGIWWQSSNANATVARNYPVASSAGNLLVLYNSVSNYGVTQIYSTHVSKRIFIRSKPTPSDAWTTWDEFWTSANLPNPATLDTAQNITGLKQFRRNSEAFMIFPAEQGKSSFIRGNEVDGSSRWYLGYGGDNVNTLTLHNYKASNGIYFNENGDISINPADGKRIYQWQYPLLAAGLSAVADANGFWKTPESPTLTPSSIGALSVTELAGIPLPFPGAVAPSGFLKCNGQSFNKTTYPILAARYPTGYLPDLRAEFIRGADDGRGVDAGRALLSAQEDAMQPITAKWTLDDQAADSGVNYPPTGALYIDSSAPVNYDATSNRDNAGARAVFDSSRQTRSANETRPRNIAFNYIVRAA